MADPAVLYVISGGTEYSPDSDDYFNITTLQRALNSLKVVTNSQAKELIYQANKALDKASIKSVTVKSLVPGATDAHDIIVGDVKKVRDKLAWHKAQIGSDGKLIYDHPDDLKKWFMEAFIVYNKSVEGKRTEDAVSLFKEVIASIARLYQETKKATEKSSSWVGTALAVATVGTVAYGIWAFKMESMRSKRMAG